jgi:hypothetical protein
MDELFKEHEHVRFRHYGIASRGMQSRTQTSSVGYEIFGRGEQYEVKSVFSLITVHKYISQRTHTHTSYLAVLISGQRRAEHSKTQT